MVGGDKYMRNRDVVFYYKEIGKAVVQWTHMEVEIDSVRMQNT
jgi:hypothetical protein